MECAEVTAEGSEFFTLPEDSTQNETVLWNGRHIRVLNKEENILLQRKLDFVKLVPNLQATVTNKKEYLWLALEIDENDEPEEVEEQWEYAKTEVIRAYGLYKENATMEEILAEAGFAFAVDTDARIIHCKSIYKKVRNKAKKIAKKVVHVYKKVEHAVKKGAEWAGDHKTELIFGTIFVIGTGAAGLAIASGAAAASATGTAVAVGSAAAAATAAREEALHRKREEDRRSSGGPDPDPEHKADDRPKEAQSPKSVLENTTGNLGLKKPENTAVQDIRQNPLITGRWTSVEENSIQPPFKYNPAQDTQQKTTPVETKPTTTLSESSQSRSALYPPHNSSSQDITKNPLVTGDWTGNKKDYAKPPFINKSDKGEIASQGMSSKMHTPIPSIEPKPPRVVPEPPLPSTFPHKEIILHAIDPENHSLPRIDLLQPGAPRGLYESGLYKIEGIWQKGMGLGFGNGMNNTYKEATDNALYLHFLSSGREIHGVFAHSNGPVLDLLEIGFSDYNGYSERTSALYEQQWTRFHEENRDNPRAKFLQHCHSRGAIQVKNALMHLPEEIRQRVIVVAIAPAIIVPEELCYQSFNYASKKDIVPFGEVAHGLLRSAVLEGEERATILQELGENRHQLIILEPHLEAKGFDHEFRSKTYEKVLIKHLKEYEEKKGQFE